MTLKAGSTFTAGPWTFISKHPQNACADVYADEGCTSIAVCYGGDDAERDEHGVWGPQPTRDANARLIAEAGTIAHETGLTPRQLAERCKELVGVVQDLINVDPGVVVNYSGEDLETFRRAHEAIAKAEGGTHA